MPMYLHVEAGKELLVVCWYELAVTVADEEGESDEHDGGLLKAICNVTVCVASHDKGGDKSEEEMTSKTGSTQDYCILLNYKVHVFSLVVCYCKSITKNLMLILYQSEFLSKFEAKRNKASSSFQRRHFTAGISYCNPQSSSLIPHVLLHCFMNLPSIQLSV